jgi:GNAT superfamily N-acetyltransferase
MVEYVRTDSSNADFRGLVGLLDADLRVRDGDDHAFFAQFNGIEMIRHVIVGYKGGIAVGCGAIKDYSQDTAEVKRMYVDVERRGLGIGSGILGELERWAVELGFGRCILETGKKQIEAIGLYGRNGYSVIANYGQYEGVDMSLCFEKVLPR